MWAGRGLCFLYTLRYARSSTARCWSCATGDASDFSSSEATNCPRRRRHRGGFTDALGDCPLHHLEVAKACADVLDVRGGGSGVCRVLLCGGLGMFINALGECPLRSLEAAQACANALDV